MKQKLHIYFFVCVLLGFSKLSTAQTTTWDFTTSNPSWAATGMGTSPIEIIDSKGLGLHGIATNANFAAWNTTSSSTWASPNDPYSAATVRVQTNGAGFAAGANESLPTQRYFFIQVDQACTVKVWFKSGSGGAQRSVIVSDGTTNYGKVTANTGATGVPADGAFLSASVTKAGTFYIYGDAAVNIFQIQVVGATVSTSPANPLPVTFDKISATKIISGINVAWSILSEINAANYVVERSIDGTNFSAVGSVDATNAGKYSYIDLSASAGNNYYRIKAFDKDGTFAYSSVVFTVADSKVASVTVYPNPITNKQVNVQLSNLSKGSYNIEVYNNLGQAVLAKAIQFDGGASSLTLQLPSSVSAGLYRLSVSNGATKINKTISVQ